MAHPDLEALTQKALEANKTHQLALVQYAEKLAEEIRVLEILMDNVTADEIEDGPGSEIRIPGAKKPTGPCPVSEFLHPDSPFFQDALCRRRWLNDTTRHLMKPKELQALADAVKGENLRLRAYQSLRNDQANNVPIDTENNVEGLDWDIIAEKVSIASTTTRTADQCRIKWLGDRHPRLNHGEWSASELDDLKCFVTEQQMSHEGSVDWVVVAAKLGTNRVPLDCMRKGISRQRHTWNEEYDQRLSAAVQRYGINNWSVVARVVSEHATAAQCQWRYLRTLDPTMQKGKWSQTELERLEVAVAAYGNSWLEVATCLPGRTNQQCRERWTEHIAAPSAPAHWTEEDDEMLVNAVHSVGNQWKAISTKVGNGATGAQCRLRYKKIQRSKASQPDMATNDPSDLQSSVVESLQKANEDHVTARHTSTAKVKENDSQTLAGDLHPGSSQAQLLAKGKRRVRTPPDGHAAIKRKKRKVTETFQADVSPSAPGATERGTAGTRSVSKKQGRPRKVTNPAATENVPGPEESEQSQIPQSSKPRPHPRPFSRNKAKVATTAQVFTYAADVAESNLGVVPVQQVLGVDLTSSTFGLVEQQATVPRRQSARLAGRNSRA